MSQHDIDIANQTGASFRADLNSAIAAGVTLNSGDLAPLTTFAHMLWAQPINNICWQRNAANTTWVPRFTLTDGPFVGVSSDTAIVQADFGKTFIALSGFIQTFGLASALGNAWYMDYQNISTGAVTLTPTSPNLIDGAVTRKIWPGEGCRIVCNGIDFFTIGALSTQGVFTPTIAFGGASVGITYTSQSGNWWRTGNMCHVEGFVNPAAQGSSTGILTVEGLPFAKDGPTNQKTLSPIAWFQFAAQTYVQMAAGMFGGATGFQVFTQALAADQGLINQLDSGDSIGLMEFSFSYPVI